MRRPEKNTLANQIFKQCFFKVCIFYLQFNEINSSHNQFPFVFKQPDHHTFKDKQFLFVKNQASLKMS